MLSKGIIVNSYVEALKGEYTDKKIVITGTFENYKRSDLEDIFSSKGLVVQSSVGKSTDILVVGEKAGSKLEKAKKFGTQIIKEKDLEEFLEKLQ